LFEKHRVHSHMYMEAISAARPMNCQTGLKG
jgi:hypothetical protein